MTIIPIRAYPYRLADERPTEDRLAGVLRPDDVALEDISVGRLLRDVHAAVARHRDRFLLALVVDVEAEVGQVLEDLHQVEEGVHPETSGLAVESYHEDLHPQIHVAVERDPSARVGLHRLKGLLRPRQRRTDAEQVLQLSRRKALVEVLNSRNVDMHLVTFA